MFRYRQLVAALGIALIFTALFAPLSHALLGDSLHDHGTCASCQLKVSTEGVVTPVSEFLPLPDLVVTEILVPIFQSFVPAFDYAVAHPRGPPACLEV